MHEPTDEQLRCFDEKGCVPRCLMKLAGMADGAGAKRDFCRRFATYFTDQGANYGLLEGMNVGLVAQALDIPDPIRKISAYRELLTEVNGHHYRALIMSEKDLDDGADEISGHCSCLLEIKPYEFTFWSPWKDGSSGKRSRPPSYWDDKNFWALIYPPQ